MNYPQNINEQIRIYQGEIWLTVSALEEAGLERNTVEGGMKRKLKIWQNIQDPKDGRRRLVKYSTLRDIYKEAVRAELCGGLEPAEWVVMLEEQAKQSKQLGNRAALIDKVQDMCDDGYRYKMHLYYGDGLTERQQRRLARAAGVVEVITKWYKANKIAWKSSEPIHQVATWMKQNEDEYKMYLPSNSTRLKEKVLAFAVEGLELNEVITLPRAGNENRASQRKEMWWQQIAMALRVHGRNLTDRAIFRKVRDIAISYDYECPSETTVGNLIRGNRFLTADKHLDLNNKGRQRHRSSMPIAPSMFADECWEMDGTRVQLAAHKVGDKELKSLYIVAVRDVYSGAYLGYWYGYSESENAYRSALKMAVDITGHLPYELRYDKFPGSTSAGWEFLAGKKDKKGNTIIEGELERHGVKMTCTSSSTGKASMERAFYTLQQVFESQNRAYIGQGIRSSTVSARPTELYISRTWKSLLSNGWTYDQVWMEHAEIVAAYNHTEYSNYSKKNAKLDLSPWSMYEASESEGRAIGLSEISQLFWNARHEGVRNNRIEFTDRGNKYRYDVQVENYDLLYNYQKPNVKVVVRHDPFDFSTIMVFSAQGEFLAEIQEQKNIQVYGRNANWKEATAWRENQKAIDKRRATDLSKYELPDEMAVLLPTVASKQVYNDAQSEYALANAANWQADEVKRKAKKQPKVTTMEDFDADAFARSQY